MPYKIRVSKKKKEGVPTQEIKGWFDHITEQCSSRPLLTMGVIATVAVILISIPAYRIWIRQSEDRAWALEIEASRLFHEKPSLSEADKKDVTKVETSMERLTKAATLYDDILNRYPESGAAKIAQFEGGNVYFDLEKYDLAEKRYLAFLKNETERKELLPLVHLRLAYLYQKQKKDALALDHFGIVYEWEGGLNKDQAGFEKGSLLERIGKKAEAMETYKKVSGAFTESPWGTEAKARLAMLDPATKAAQATSTPAVVTGPPATAAPVAAKFSPPLPTKLVQKKTVPVVVTPQAPAVHKSIPTPVVTPVPAPTTPAVQSPSTAVPLEITPEQLRMLREKGSLTVPLPKQEPKPKAETPAGDARPAVVAPPNPTSPVSEKGGTPPAKAEPVLPAGVVTPSGTAEPKKEGAPLPSGSQEHKPE